MSWHAPLGLAGKVHHTGARGVDIADGGLFVETVEAELVGLRGLDGAVLSESRSRIKLQYGASSSRTSGHSASNDTHLGHVLNGSHSLLELSARHVDGYDSGE